MGGIVRIKKTGFQSESLYRIFHHVSDNNNNNNHQNHTTLAQNEHGSDGSKKSEKIFSVQNDLSVSQYTSGVKIFRSYAVRIEISVVDWGGDFARFELAFSRSDLGL